MVAVNKPPATKPDIDSCRVWLGWYLSNVGVSGGSAAFAVVDGRSEAMADVVVKARKDRLDDSLHWTESVCGYIRRSANMLLQRLDVAVRCRF